MKITRWTGIVASVGVLVLGIAGCSTSISHPASGPTDSEPTATPSPTTTQTASASPSSSPSATSAATKFTLSSGGTVKIAGQGAGTWKAEGGEMKVSNEGEGPLGGTIEVFAKGDAKKGDFDLQLETDSEGKVTGGNFESPGVGYDVTGDTGQINFLSTADGTTLVTVTDIPVQQDTDTPTTMSIELPATRN